MNRIERRSFGKTALQVSVLGLGGYAFHKLSADGTRQLLDRAFDMGINVIDTAECYKYSEELIGQALGTQRQGCYLFTKCGHASGFDLPDWSPHLLEHSIERSLQRLKTDYLDLVLLHSCSYEILRQGDVIAVLQRAQQAGKTRYIGYSGDRKAARYAVECGAFDALEISVNIADQEAIDEIVPLAVHKQMGVIAKRPLANAIWLADAKPEVDYLQRYWNRLRKLNYPLLNQPRSEAMALALRFTLSVPGVDVVLVGMTQSEHVVYNQTSILAGSLPQGEYEAVRRRWKSLTWWRRVLPGSRWGWHGVV